MNLRDAIALNAHTIDNLSKPQMSGLLSVLREVRADTERGFGRWLKKVDDKETYSVHQHRVLVAELGHGINLLEHSLAGATGVDLATGAKLISPKSLASLVRVAQAGERQFRDAAVPLRLDTAMLLKDSSRVLMHRHDSSAKRYAGRRGKDIQHQLAVGVIKGENVGQLVRRLGKIQLPQYSRMSVGQKAESVADNQFFRSKADAERLIRTEFNHAANWIQNDALVSANREAGGDGGWQSRWDAMLDRRTCVYCEDLDGAVAQAGALFFSRLVPEGIAFPPLHPCDRCSISAWREGWKI